MYGEAEDKLLKYPTIFNSSDVAVITKSDLAAAVEFDELLARRDTQAVRPACRYSNCPPKPANEWPTFWNFSKGCTRVPVALPQSEHKRSENRPLLPGSRNVTISCDLIGGFCTSGNEREFAR
jgi:hypothetical protein